MGFLWDFTIFGPFSPGTSPTGLAVLHGAGRAARPSAGRRFLQRRPGDLDRRFRVGI